MLRTDQPSVPPPCPASAGIALAALLGATALLATACSGGGMADDGAGALQTYQVRGEVTRLAAEQGALYIRHEAIDDFVGIDGEVVGMSAMTMPFPLAEGVGVDGVAAGDKVRFTLEVEWSAEELPYRITRVERLPEDTELEFRKAEPGG